MARSSAQRADVADPASRETLTSRCISGDPDAWRDFHRGYYPVAASFLRKLGVRDAEMEDACQEVFLQIFRYLPGFRGEAELTTWLYRLCATEAGRWRRRSRVMALLGGWLRGQAALQPAAGQEFDSGLARKRVEAALASLKPAERTVFVLFEMEGLSGEQIAGIVDCPVATVWRRLHYARQAFRESLEAGGSA